MWNKRNKNRKNTTSVKETKSSQDDTKVKNKKPKCTCGGSGWISKIIRRPAFGPDQYVRTTCSCNN